MFSNATYLSSKQLILILHYLVRQQDCQQWLHTTGFAYALSLHPPDIHQNYFFQIGNVIGLCVENTQDAIRFAELWQVSQHIFFGTNCDPVKVLTIDEVLSLYKTCRWLGHDNTIQEQSCPNQTTAIMSSSISCSEASKELMTLRLR